MRFWPVTCRGWPGRRNEDTRAPEDPPAAAACVTPPFMAEDLRPPWREQIRLRRVMRRSGGCRQGADRGQRAEYISRLIPAGAGMINGGNASFFVVNLSATPAALRPHIGCIPQNGATAPHAERGTSGVDRIREVRLHPSRRLPTTMAVAPASASCAVLRGYCLTRAGLLRSSSCAKSPLPIAASVRGSASA